MFNKTSSVLKRQIPDYITNLYTNASGDLLFLEFIKAYYEWSEQTGETDNLIKTSMDFFDSDQVFGSSGLAAFHQYFFNSFLPGIPNSVLVNKALLVKHAREFYINKGNENSYKFLFRILFDEDITIYIPNKHLLTASDKVKGIISIDNKVQDSFYWQQFSYEISTSKSLEEYKEILLKLIHPAGLKLFGRFVTELSANVMGEGFATLLLAILGVVNARIRSANVYFDLVLGPEALSGPVYSSLLKDPGYMRSFDPKIYMINATNSKAYAPLNTTSLIYLKKQGLDFPTSFFNNAYVTIISGTGMEQTRKILTWTENATNIQIVPTVAFSTLPDSTSLYKIFKNQINEIGVAQSGAATTITLASNEIAIDDFYNDRFSIYIVAGIGAGQTRVITDYVGSTKVATVASAWSTNPTSNSVYVIKKTEVNDANYFTTYSNMSLRNFANLTISDFYNEGALGTNQAYKGKARKAFAEIELFLS